MMKMVVVADRQTSLPFLGVGIDIVVNQEIEKAKGAIGKLFEEEKHGIIFIAQSLAAECLDLIEELSEKKSFPIITVIPDSRGEVSGIAEQRLGNLIKKAVGMELPVNL